MKKRIRRYVHPLDRIGGEAAELRPTKPTTPEPPKPKLALVRTRRDLAIPTCKACSTSRATALSS